MADFKKKGDAFFSTRNLMYLILIIACILVIWFIVNGIIKKLLVLD